MKTRVGGIAALLNDSGNDDDGPADIESGKAAPKKKKTGPCGLPDTKAGWSPLQVNLEALAVKLGYMAIGVCLVVFIVGFLMGTKDPESPETPSRCLCSGCGYADRGGYSRGPASVRDNLAVLGLFVDGAGERAHAQDRRC